MLKMKKKPNWSKKHISPYRIIIQKPAVQQEHLEVDQLLEFPPSVFFVVCLHDGHLVVLDAGLDVLLKVQGWPRDLFSGDLDLPFVWS